MNANPTGPAGGRLSFRGPLVATLLSAAKADPNRGPSTPNRFRHCVGDQDGMGRSGPG